MTTQITRHWRLNAQRYSLIGNVCPDCNRRIFPPRDVCPHCAEKASLPFQFDHWKLDPQLALKFIEDQMIPTFSLGNYRVHSEISQIKGTRRHKMSTNGILTQKEKELVAVGASIAAGCQPCATR